MKNNRAPFYIGVIAAVYALTGGTLSLMGWVFDIPRLSDWWQTGIGMKANTAIGTATAGLTLLIALLLPTATAFIRIVGFAVFLLGGLTLLQHITGLDFGIDTLLFVEPPGATATAAPGRMGPPAALSLAALGTAFMLLTGNVRARSASIGIAIVVFLIGMLSLVGYWYGAKAMYMVPRLTGIALQTATMVVALSIGMIAAQPDRQPLKILRADSYAGMLARRLIPIAIGVPLILGWLRNMSWRAGIFDNAFATALRSMVEMVLLLGIIWWSVQAIRAREIQQRRAEAKRHWSEHQFRATLLEADRRKDEFLATLAHELRNPLAPIRNAAATLLLETGGISDTTGSCATEGGDSQSRQSAGIIDRQIRHMARLLDDLLDVSRISRGRMELHKEIVELKHIVDSAIETSKPAIDAAEHRLTVSLPPEPIHVRADALRLAQVFSNLLNNAANYTHNRGRIAINVRQNGSDAQVDIADNGFGIEPGALPHIFDMFTQAKPESPKARSGLGIGLALARGIVELHGGRIEVRSGGTGMGSLFTVSLPLAAASDIPRHPVTTAAATENTLRLLVVDDMKDNAETFAALLRMRGHDTRAAYDGNTAIDIARTFRPQAIFLDIGMPGTDGLQVCRLIRKHDWGRDIVIAAVTGWGQERDRLRTLEAGFDAHFVKPIEPAVAFQWLTAVCSSTRTSEIVPNNALNRGNS